MKQHTAEFIERIPPARQAEGGRLLAGPGAGRAAGERFVDAARGHGVRLDEFWGSSLTRGGPYVAAALLVPGAGRTMMTYTSTPRGAGGAATVARLLDHACGAWPGGGVAQALLEPGETASRIAFERAGFVFVGELLYMRREWSEPAPELTEAGWPGGVTVEPWRSGMEPDLALALDRSYEGTLDCPELCGMRATADVIESHRSTGKFDPSLWWLVRAGGEPAGALLLNPNPAQDHTELVYLGLAPGVRGMGLAGRLLRMGLRSLPGRAPRTALCAVDSRNTPALRLYERAGFREFARRSAFVRPLASADKH